MGIRETLNKQPALTTGATIAIIVVALGIILYEIMGNSAGYGKPPTQAFYTVDDGATWFKDDINLVPPFDHEGKEAVKANIFKCKSGKPFVAYLEKYTPEAKKVIESLRGKAPGPNGDPAALEQATNTGLLVKQPLAGPKGWLKPDQKGAEKVTALSCPDGSSTETLEPVMP